MMHIASVILSLALGLISGAKIGMNEKTDFSNPNINLNDDFNLPFGSLEETRQGECLFSIPYARHYKPRLVYFLPTF